MARIAGVDLPRNKRIEIALTYIYGLGRHAANVVLTQAGHLARQEERRSRRERRPQDPRRDRANYRVEGDLRRDMQLNIKRLSISAATAACAIAGTCRLAVSARTPTPAPARVRAAWR